MATPQIPIVPTSQGWDAPLNDALDVLGRAGDPVPLPLHSGDESDMPTASDFDQCSIWVDHTTLGRVVATSDGSTWTFHRGVAVPDSTAATVSDLKDDFNALLASLRASGALEP